MTQTFNENVVIDGNADWDSLRYWQWINYIIPDLQGHVGVGPDNMGTAHGDAARLTANDVRGNSGGTEKHTLVAGEMPIHSHEQNSHGHTSPAHSHTSQTATLPVRENSSMTTGDGTIPTLNSNISNAVRTVTLTASQSATVTINAIAATSQDAGGGLGHNNVQPYQVVNKAILIAY